MPSAAARGSATRRLSATRPGGSARTGRRRGARCAAKTSPTWTVALGRTSPLATSTNTRRRASPGATAAGRPPRARATAARARPIRPHRPRCRRPAPPSGGPRSSAVRRPEEGDDRSIEDRPDVARRGVQEPERPDREGDRTAGPGGRDEGELRAGRPEIDGGTAEDVRAWRIGPVAALDDDRVRGGLARSDIRPEQAVRGDAGARKPPGPTAAGSTDMPSGPVSPKNAPGSAPPLWTSRRVGSAHAQYIGEPARTRGRGAPVGRHETQGEAVGLRGQERQAPAVRGPVEVERRMVRARVDRRRRPVAAPSARPRRRRSGHPPPARGPRCDRRPATRRGRRRRPRGSPSAWADPPAWSVVVRWPSASTMARRPADRGRRSVGRRWPGPPARP